LTLYIAYNVKYSIIVELLEVTIQRNGYNAPLDIRILALML